MGASITRYFEICTALQARLVVARLVRRLPQVALSSKHALELLCCTTRNLSGTLKLGWEVLAVHVLTCCLAQLAE